MASSTVDGVALALFGGRVQAICDEMGVILKRAAFSPNIKDRLDFSCALFDAHGALFGQAAHIPVHLGSMAYAMADIVARFVWQADDLVLLNDPYLGGTHLPDVTAVCPVFDGDQLVAFAACRAHHANIGADRPGSMPVSTSLFEEGVVISPMLAQRAGSLTADACALFDRLSARAHGSLEDFRSDARLGDFFAQMSACRLGAQRLQALVRQMGRHEYNEAIRALNDYAQRLAQDAIAAIPPGEYAFEDRMDDDGAGATDVPIRVRLQRGRRRGRRGFFGYRRSGARQHQLPAVGDGSGGVVRAALFDAGPHARGERRVSLRSDRDARRESRRRPIPGGGRGR